jgi:hypothetical protein
VSRLTEACAGCLIQLGPLARMSGGGAVLTVRIVRDSPVGLRGNCGGVGLRQGLFATVPSSTTG